MKINDRDVAAQNGTGEHQTTDREFFTQSCIWRTIELVFDIDGFDPSPTNIAKKLNCSLEEVIEALDGLERMGLLIRDANKGYQRTHQCVNLSSDNMLKQAVIQHVLLTQQLHGSLQRDYVNNTLWIRDYFISTNRQLLQEYLGKVNAAFVELIKKSDEQPVDNVYAVSCLAMKMTDEGKNGKGGNNQ